MSERDCANIITPPKVSQTQADHGYLSILKFLRKRQRLLPVKNNLKVGKTDLYWKPLLNHIQSIPTCREGRRFDSYIAHRIETPPLPWGLFLCIRSTLSTRRKSTNTTWDPPPMSRSDYEHTITHRNDSQIQVDDRYRSAPSSGLVILKFNLLIRSVNKFYSHEDHNLFVCFFVDIPLHSEFPQVFCS